MRFPLVILMLVLTGAAQGCATAALLDAGDRGPVITRDTAWIKLKRVNEGAGGTGAWVVPVTFDDHEENCLLDTGSMKSFIFESKYSLALPAGQRVWYGGLSGSDIASHEVRPPIFALGGVPFADQKLVLKLGPHSSAF